MGRGFDSHLWLKCSTIKGSLGTNRMLNSSRYAAVQDRKTERQPMASSRLVKKEKSKLQKQTLWYLLIGVASLLLFIFVLMPAIIRLFFAIIDTESPLTEVDSVPPQVPVLTANPPEATFSATLALSGFAEPKSLVVFLLNSSKVAEVQSADDGTFSHEISLADGANDLVIFGVDDGGNESLKTRSYQIARDSEVPFLEIEEPSDGKVIELEKNRTLTIKGKTEPDARLLINDRLVLADKEGNFSSNYYLSEGKNTLKFVVTDRATNQLERSIEVEFRL